jgi:hypothetical protein
MPQFALARPVVAVIPSSTFTNGLHTLLDPTTTSSNLFDALQDDRAGPGSAVATQRALLSGRYRPIPASVGAGPRRIIQGLLVVDAARRLDLEVCAFLVRLC